MTHRNGTNQPQSLPHMLGDLASDLLAFWGTPRYRDAVFLCGTEDFFASIHTYLKRILRPGAAASGFDIHDDFERLVYYLACTISTVAEAITTQVTRPDLASAAWYLVWHGLRSRTVALTRCLHLMQLRTPELPADFVERFRVDPLHADLKVLYQPSHRLYLTQACLLLPAHHAWACGWLLARSWTCDDLLRADGERRARWPIAFADAAVELRRALEQLLFPLSPPPAPPVAEGSD